MSIRLHFGRLGGTGGATSFAILALPVALVVATAALVWVGYRAIQEWQKSTALLVDQRATERLTWLSTTLSRDMRGVQVSVLVPINHEALDLDSPYDLAEAFAHAFARFPYPESFFIWKSTGHSDGATYFFNRTARRPPWDLAANRQDPYPVIIEREPTPMQGLIRQVRRQAASGASFALLDMDVQGVRYQTVVRLLYDGSRKGTLFGMVGFTVNIPWVREHYFADLTREVARLGGDANPMSLAVFDDAGTLVTSTGPAEASGSTKERPFPFVFIDPKLLSSLPRPSTAVPQWWARVNPSASDSLLAAASRGAGRLLLLLSLAALATMVSLVFAVRAVRVATALANMKSEFVSTVTHELKTPLALMRLVGETLSMGRYTSQDTIRDYARLLSEGARRHVRLIDNVLTWTRMADARRLYSFEPLETGELIGETLRSFRPRLEDLGFEVRLRIADPLPRVRADRDMLLLVLDNLVDNAVKYSHDERVLILSASAVDHRVRIVVADRGVGIPREDLPNVFDKFYRSPNAQATGSGLGLATVKRIVSEHGGSVGIRSVPGIGTSVRILLPVETPHVQARTDRRG